ncbi:hypothetical protein TEA_026696 [Camellia sinensis var. sinensis]|uniref:Serine-threonine/tyrosine-protein kinase catalytic domain-containing protein n=1 Tax=Camellia sinensis var. sinensis TaxID=542762 RepID=A0A4S4EQ33_CAMSN|nr:hypothetical protein TEA_026696 [Camellia sinensis var. sinensis]
MGVEIVEPNTCIRGCCRGDSIPLHLPPSSYYLNPITRGAESVVYEAVLDGNKVAVKKPILSTSDHIDKFHKELQMLCELLTGVVPYTDLRAEAQAHAVLEINCTEQQLTVAVVSEGLRPALAGHSSSAPTGFPSLIQRCWDANPQNRPSFDDIILELDPILECRKRVEEDEKEKALVDPSIPLGDEGIPSLLAYQKSYARSIGDDDLKPAVTAEPEITETILFVEDEYLELNLNNKAQMQKNMEVEAQNLKDLDGYYI